MEIVEVGVQSSNLGHTYVANAAEGLIEDRNPRWAVQDLVATSAMSIAA